MAEPDNLVFEHLGAIRAELGELTLRVTTIKHKLCHKAEAAQVADVKRKLDGLTHVVISSLAPLVRSLKSRDNRVSRLEREPVEP